MFDPKIDNAYCNSQGEFVDIYTEFRLPDGPDSGKDAIIQAYRNFVRACHPDVCRDKELAEAMTKFANRARAVLEMERAPYNARWQQERGRKKNRSKRTGTDSSSKGWTVPPVVEKAVGCIVPLIGVGAVAVGLTALYNWKGSDWLEALQARPESKAQARAPQDDPEYAAMAEKYRIDLELRRQALQGECRAALDANGCVDAYTAKKKAENPDLYGPEAEPPVQAEPTIPAPAPKIQAEPIAKPDLKASVSEFQTGWFPVDSSKVSQLLGETKIGLGTDKEQEGEIVKHRACAAFTISCQNGVTRGYSVYWLQDACPELSGREPLQSGYPDRFRTATYLSSHWFTSNGDEGMGTDGILYNSVGTSGLPVYPDLSPHPHIVCSEKSTNEEITGYRTFLSLRAVK